MPTNLTKLIKIKSISSKKIKTLNQSIKLLKLSLWMAKFKITQVKNIINRIVYQINISEIKKETTRKILVELFQITVLVTITTKNLKRNGLTQDKQVPKQMVST